MSDRKREELILKTFSIEYFPSWIHMLNLGADYIRENERMLKQAYTDFINEGMAFGL